MRCSEVKGYLGPYLDSELDRDLTWRIVSHLESCAGCRERFEREERIEAAVRDRLQSEVGDEELVFQRALDSALERTEKRTVPRILIGAAFGVLILIGTLSILSLFRDPFGPLSSVPAVFENALADHEKYAQGVLGPRDESLEDAVGYIERELALVVDLPNDEWTVQGARVRRFGEERVGYFMLKRGESLVSVFVLPRESAEESNETLCWSLGGDVRGVMRQAKSHDVCVVGDLRVDVLERLAREVH